jgi:hypothetical protein
MLLVASSTPNNGQRLRVNEEDAADRPLLRHYRRQPLASTSTLAYGLTTVSGSALNRNTP